MSTCSSCGAPRAEEGRFCPACGAAYPAPTGAAAGAPKSSTLAVVALVMAFIPCLGLLSIPLGIVALVRIQSRPQALRGTGMAIAAIALPLGLTSIFGVLAAIAIPNFVRFQSRAKQAEARTNLKSLAVLEEGYREEHGAPAKTFDALGFTPEPHRRYAYFLAGDVIQPDLGGPYEVPADLKAQVSDPSVFAYAVGNLDGDDTLDVWTIDTGGAVHTLRDDTHE
jgi:type II secretory pathway pseudopilin PulG